MIKIIRKIKHIYWELEGYFKCIVLQNHIVSKCNCKNGRCVYHCNCGRVIQLLKKRGFIGIDTKKKEVIIDSEKEDIEIEVK